MSDSNVAVVILEATEPYADGVTVNPVQRRLGPTYLVDPDESEEATEPFLTSLRSQTELSLNTRHTTTEEDSTVRWRLPSSLLAL